MARRELILCDHCGQPAGKPVCVNVDRKMDGAGSMETHTEVVDFCHGCAVSALNLIFGGSDYEGGRSFVFRWRKQVKA